VLKVPLGEILGRCQSGIDLGLVGDHLAGKRVLVVGAGGSIGAEISRQIRDLDPAELILVDRDESALHAVQLSLYGRALLSTPDTILADLRDAEAIQRIFATSRPQTVFHSAALKHLPLLQRFPGEAVKTNVWGTQTLLDASCDVDCFVNISTDKAANPTSVLGYSKRITERLTAHAATRYPGKFLSVRFGNVLGSRGSVLTAFQAQAAAGGPITVTHPEVTRYLMTVQEAVHLVIQATAIGRCGEVLVANMGAPVSIESMARQIVAAHGDKSLDIVYTGLRPGEKLHEELFGCDETVRTTRHPLISYVDVPPLDPSELRFLDAYAGHETVCAQLALACQVGIDVWRRDDPEGSKQPLGVLTDIEA
jgi:FlaA1/EpsC-like NDP-sugar epimerase